MTACSKKLRTLYVLCAIAISMINVAFGDCLDGRMEFKGAGAEQGKCGFVDPAESGLVPRPIYLHKYGTTTGTYNIDSVLTVSEHYEWSSTYTRPGVPPGGSLWGPTATTYLDTGWAKFYTNGVLQCQDDNYFTDDVSVWDDGIGWSTNVTGDADAFFDYVDEGDAHNGGTGSSYDSEYKDSDVIQEISDKIAYPSEWAPGDGSAYFHCDDNHWIDSGGKMKYRLKITNFQPNTTCWITGKKLTVYDDGRPSKPENIPPVEVKLSGADPYYWPDEGGKEEGVPSEPCIISITLSASPTKPETPGNGGPN